MERSRQRDGRKLIDPASPRAVFAELLARAVGETGVEPSPVAVSYLIELLEERVRAPEPEVFAVPAGEQTLAVGLLRARRERGAARLRRLRTLGDRALFVSGFFGESLARSPVDLGYYRQAGRSAYGQLSELMLRELRERVWAQLFEELADRFREFVDVLAEVSDGGLRPDPPSLLRLFERYQQTGSPRDRRLLARRGHVPLQPPGPRRWQ